MSRRHLALFVMLLTVILTACKDNTPSRSPTAQPVFTPTIPAVITKIVTPRPTYTPLPTPTLDYDVEPVAGRWIMRFQITILDNPFVDEISYSAVADLQVNIDGSISGTGHFSQNVNQEGCNARVTDSTPLNFTITGTTRPEGDQIWADLHIVPADPFQPESYTVICPTYNDVRSQSAAILWPALTALNRLTWGFIIENDQVFTFESDLSQDTGGQIDGQLSAEVRFNRN
jgi:hypothetical protein